MLLVNFSAKHLKKFQSIIARTAKSLAKLASSTATDLLISQGLTNVTNMQSACCLDFALSLLKIADEPCRTSTQITLLHLRFASPFHGTCPFSSRGLGIPHWDSRLPTIFQGLRPTLLRTNTTLKIESDPAPTTDERQIARVLPHILSQHRDMLEGAGFAQITLRTLLPKLLKKT
jgi:hypothetical protein